MDFNQFTDISVLRTKQQKKNSSHKFGQKRFKTFHQIHFRPSEVGVLRQTFRWTEQYGAFMADPAQRGANIRETFKILREFYMVFFSFKIIHQHAKRWYNRLQIHR